jgi:hypothetical protein
VKFRSSRDLAETIKELPQFDPVKLSSAIEEMALTLSKISDTIIRGEYLKRVSKILNTKTSVLNHIIECHEEKEKRNAKKDPNRIRKRRQSYLSYCRR